MSLMFYPFTAQYTCKKVICEPIKLVSHWIKNMDNGLNSVLTHTRVSGVSPELQQCYWEQQESRKTVLSSLNQWAWSKSPSLLLGRVFAGVCSSGDTTSVLLSNGATGAPFLRSHAAIDSPLSLRPAPHHCWESTKHQKYFPYFHRGACYREQLFPFLLPPWYASPILSLRVCMHCNVSPELVELKLADHGFVKAGLSIYTHL